MKRKNVVCFVESMGGGGAEHQMQILCDLLSSKGYDVTLVTYADVPDHYRISSDVKRVRLSEGRNAFGKFLGIFFYFLKVRTDCVISFRHACSARVLIPMFFRRRSRVRVICGERNLSQRNVDFYQKILFRFLYRRADYIVPNSVAQTRYIEEVKPALRHKLRTIINYTEMPGKPCTMPQVRDKIRIGIFARYSWQKNPVGLARMVSGMGEESAKLDIQWYGASKDANGSLNADYLKAINVVEQLGVGDVLHFNDSVARPSDLMDTFHAIALPSHYEGFSNSISEAICCGKPVLAGDVSDNGTMVHDGVNGFLFNPYDIDDMAGAFRKFVSLTPEAMAQMGAESRRIAQQLFDKEKFVNSYIELIEK